LQVLVDANTAMANLQRARCASAQANQPICVIFPAGHSEQQIAGLICRQQQRTNSSPKRIGVAAAAAASVAAKKGKKIKQNQKI